MTETTDRQAIIDLEKRRIAALTSCDVQALGALMADDLVHVHGNGHMDDKAAYLEGIRTKYIFHRIERGEMNIRVYGDTAVVVAPLDQTVEVRGNDKRNEIKAVSTQTWVRAGDSWKQSTCHMGFLSMN
jgi:ketosteroid isomerase-like protein